MDDDLRFAKELHASGVIGKHVREDHVPDVVRSKPKLLQAIGQMTRLSVRTRRRRSRTQFDDAPQNTRQPRRCDYSAGAGFVAA